MDEGREATVDSRGRDDRERVGWGLFVPPPRRRPKSFSQMDQAAFRELLSTPRAGGSSTSRSKFGAAKRTSGESCVLLSSPPSLAANHTRALTTLAYNSKKETFKKPDFKPRDKGKKFKKKDGEGEDGGYRNRAEERRLGKDSDFAGVEKLLEVSA